MDPTLGRFPQKRAFVTGAGSGLGRALCCHLARLGWTLGIQDVNPTTAWETLEQVVALGGRGEVYVFDVSKWEAFEEAARAFVSAHGGIDLAVNNAGVAAAGPVGEIPVTDWQWIVGINLFGVIHGCHAFAPVMKAQRSGHIVNIASLAGLVTAPHLGAYSATKFAVVGLSEAMRMELDGTGASVSVVCPSFFQTSLNESARAAVTEADQMRQAVAVLMQRSSLSAEGVAACILDAVARDRLYVLPHRDGRFLWFLKRLSPRLFLLLTTRGHQRRLLDKLVARAALKK
jgi:NAD(P)-dependent dehydrogenase (short-subunit alcohol dehydrogenase family)